MGDWIELEVTLPQDRVYADSLALQGGYNMTGTLSVIVLDPDPHGLDLISSFTFTGQGVGCGNPILWIEGSASFPLDAGTYTIRVQHASGAAAYVDVVRFAWDDTPARVTTLGRVKALYR